MLVNHNTRINTEDTERERNEAQRNLSEENDFFLRVKKSSSFSEEHRDCEREREFSFSFTHTSGGSITIQNYMSLPFSLCFVLEKQREREKNDDLNARKARTLIAFWDARYACERNRVQLTSPSCPGLILFFSNRLLESNGVQLCVDSSKLFASRKNETLN